MNRPSLILLSFEIRTHGVSGMKSDAQETEIFTLPSVPDNMHTSSYCLKEKHILFCRTTEHCIQHFIGLESHY